ncbi:sugar ABC transporter substrate-binding protein [Paenibacillus sp. FSL R7-0331]|uniref:sugar ABC transporter substrate-binding protein n=1 Tax=Paenibacillus sp. FSL R7-0331 TaxID=1536773 RepID=UPI0004F7A6E9|nr:substrate-binding domain-containing protein [Paenibacillus sp. FSL R7-0331]AIQ51295.1 hypothetical protein R70331_07065 [Paenibacillus sp. FSL R7-0331]
MTKHMLKRSMFLLLSLLLVAGILAGCSGNSEAGEGAGGKKIKLGVLIYDATDSEVVAFKNYYEKYISKNYNVEFTYSDTINTAEQEKAAIENFISQRIKGIISFSDQDRLASIAMCEEAQVYYAVGAGTLSDEQYEQVKDNKYYVGSIGPSLDNEEQVGYDMAKYYIGAGAKNFLLYTGGYPFVSMHKKRTDGMIKAFQEAGVTYTEDSNGNIGTFSGGGFTIDTMTGFPDDSGAFYGTAGQKLGAANLEVVITAALGVELFGTSISQTNPNLKLATVSSFTDAYKSAFNAEPPQADYLAGKFASSIGPIFAAVYNAVNGDIDSVRDNGQAFRLAQGYWTAIGKEHFNEMFELSNNVETPAYSKKDLDTVIKATNGDTDFESFKQFVEAYTYEDIQKLHQ